MKLMGGKMNAQEKLEQTINDGRALVPEVLESIQKEFDTRNDYIITPQVMDFGIDSSQLMLKVNAPNMEKKYKTTEHSENQIYAKANIPITFADRIKYDEPSLLKENLTRLTARYCKKGILIREVGDTVKGYLSPSYKRMDASPIFESFVNTAVSMDYQPFRAVNTDYRYHIGLILPEVFTMSDSDALAFGIGITTSDYGSKALQIEMFALRIWCKNLAIGYDLLRRVHLGQRFSMEGEDTALQLSNETNLLDTKTIASAVSDIVKMSKNHIETFMGLINKANGKSMSSREAMLTLKGTPLLKKDSEKVMQYFDSELPVEALPQTKSAWRLSSAISLLSKEAKTQDKMLDIEKVAFNILQKI